MRISAWFVAVLGLPACALAFAPAPVSLRSVSRPSALKGASSSRSWGTVVTAPSLAPALLTRHGHGLVAPRMSTAEKQSPLEGGGARGLEEEDRRIGMWRQRFELDEAQISSIRSKYEEMLGKTSGGLRTISKPQMKLVIEAVNKDIDMVDVVSPGQRPVVAEDELSNYVAALKDLWAEACVEDAIELANGECEVPLNTDEFDLSEVVAIYGMCVRDHCGIGGVCFWDSE